MYNVLRIVFLVPWVFFHGAFGSAQTSGHGDTNSASTAIAIVAGSTPSPVLGSALRTTQDTVVGTCPSRTVNYITHTLARQCLRTDRVPHNASQTNDSDSTAAGTVSAGTAVHTALSGLPTDIHAKISNVVTPAVVSGGETAQFPSSEQISVQSAATVVDATPVPPAEEDVDSPLDNANFLSFEDWKRQNLAKAGQSPDDVGHGQQDNVHRPRPINNALEGMGEEQEINIEFAGFGGAAQAPAPEKPSSALSEQVKSEGSSGQSLRKKDAGKTCKERTNYASFDCAATILKSNKECKSASSVLVENKDSYMLNTCSADNKFFIVELCNDIQIDTVVLANYEFFSSSFRHFKLSVSDRYPVKEEKWKVLGIFEAKNTRDIQAFLIENPLIWARYLRVEFLSHYGTEYYCPVSLLRVHGTTMMEDYRHQEELARGETDDVEEATLEAEVIATPAIASGLLISSDAVKTNTEAATTPQDSKLEQPAQVSISPSQKTVTTTSSSAKGVEVSDYTTPAKSPNIIYRNGTVPMDVGIYEPPNVNMTCETLTTASSHHASATTGSTQLAGFVDDGKTEGSTSAPVTEKSHISTVAESTPSTNLVGSPISQPSVSLSNTYSGTVTSAVSNASSTVASPGVEMNNTISGTIASNPTASNMDSTRATSASPPPAQPSTQESFFKSVHKRLLQLESNSTLSLQYIEEQSRILREAFSKVEKRQVGTTSKFLTQLNETVMTELHGFRQAYDQLWQSTVIELEGQRETYQQEMLALSSRLTMVADELIWQKRMGIVQSTLLLLCLALVIFGRQGTGHIEVPVVMQHMMNRSTAALRGGWESPPNSPSPDSRSPVSLFRRKIWRSSTEPPESKYPDASDGELSRPQTREGPTMEAHTGREHDDDADHDDTLTPSLTQENSNPHVSVEPPSPPQRTESDWDEEPDRSGSPELERKPVGGGSATTSAPSSPGRKRKKPKKPPGWPQHSGMMSGGHGRPKSPLATTTMS